MTKKAEEIQDLLDTIENLERMGDENGFLTVMEREEISRLRDSVHDLGKICGNCDGDGKDVDRRQINPRSINQHYTWCSECKGEGVL